VILLVVGIVGYFLRRYGYPIAPLVIGLILGPMAEAQLRRALQLSQGDLTALFTRPFAAICYLALVVIIALGLWLRHRQSRVERALAAAAAADTSVEAAVNHMWAPGQRPTDVKTSEITTVKRDDD
jgi:putative tricarboxylic transport membrane protein